MYQALASSRRSWRFFEPESLNEFVNSKLNQRDTKRLMHNDMVMDTDSDKAQLFKHPQMVSCTDGLGFTLSVQVDLSYFLHKSCHIKKRVRETGAIEERVIENYLDSEQGDQEAWELFECVQRRDLSG